MVDDLSDDGQTISFDNKSTNMHELDAGAGESKFLVGSVM